MAFGNVLKDRDVNTIGNPRDTSKAEETSVDLTALAKDVVGSARSQPLNQVSKFFIKDASVLKLSCDASSSPEDGSTYRGEEIFSGDLERDGDGDGDGHSTEFGPIIANSLAPATSSTPDLSHKSSSTTSRSASASVYTSASARASVLSTRHSQTQSDARAQCLAQSPSTLDLLMNLGCKDGKLHSQVTCGEHEVRVGSTTRHSAKRDGYMPVKQEEGVYDLEDELANDPDEAKYGAGCHSAAEGGSLDKNIKVATRDEVDAGIARVTDSGHLPSQSLGRSDEFSRALTEKLHEVADNMRVLHKKARAAVPGYWHCENQSAYTQHNSDTDSYSVSPCTPSNNDSNLSSDSEGSVSPPTFYEQQSSGELRSFQMKRKRGRLVDGEESDQGGCVEEYEEGKESPLAEANAKIENKKPRLDHDEVISDGRIKACSSAGADTEPASPIPSPSCTSQNDSQPQPPSRALQRKRSKANKPKRIKPDPVPIIAPPSFASIPRPPPTPDDAAETRLMRLVERERQERLGTVGEGVVMGVSKDEVEALPGKGPVVGVESEVWRDVVDWVLTVTPSKSLGTPNLRSHLRGSQHLDTRYHAVLLMTRYFVRVGAGMPLPPAGSDHTNNGPDDRVAGNAPTGNTKSSTKETSLMKRGRRRIVWEVAVGCLGLAVKFHRDFLNPLCPIYAREFVAVAPVTMSRRDFELAQKDVLEVLNYNVHYVTPQAYIDELWNSLPALRRLLRFDGGWEQVQKYIWERLNAAASEPDLFRFPLYILTSAAIIEGTIDTLVSKFERDLEAKTDVPISDEEEVMIENDANLAVLNVVEDVKDLMGISKVDMRHCRIWLRSISSLA